MVTTASRMQQRRRTKTQFDAENPTLAAGEIGVTLPETGVQYPGFKIGDGATSWTGLKALQFPCAVQTVHDAKYTYPGLWSTNGTPVDDLTTDTGMPRTRLPATGTTRIKWVWEIPIEWDGMTVRFGATYPNADSGGNIKYQFAYSLVYLTTSNGIAPTMTTITMAAVDAAAQNAWHYNTPSELVNIATADGPFFGDKPFMFCCLSRLGDDAADTYAQPVDIVTVTGSRVDL